MPRRIAYDKVVRDKSSNVAKNPNYDGYHHGLPSLVYKSFDKKSSSRGVKSEIIKRQELAEELHKPIIRKFKKRKVYSSFTDNICGNELADMQLIRRFNKEFRFLLSSWHL